MMTPTNDELGSVDRDALVKLIAENISDGRAQAGIVADKILSSGLLSPSPAPDAGSADDGPGPSDPEFLARARVGSGEHPLSREDIDANILAIMLCHTGDITDEAAFNDYKKDLVDMVSALLHRSGQVSAPPRELGCIHIYEGNPPVCVKCGLRNRLASSPAPSVAQEEDLVALFWGTRVEIADYWNKPGQSGEINRASAEMLAKRVLALLNRSRPSPQDAPWSTVCAVCNDNPQFCTAANCPNRGLWPGSAEEKK